MKADLWSATKGSTLLEKGHLVHSNIEKLYNIARWGFKQSVFVQEYKNNVVIDEMWIPNVNRPKSSCPCDRVILSRPYQTVCLMVHVDM